MIDKLNKGYLAPWSGRRETMGLMGTFMVFLFSFPAHSESIKHQAYQVVQKMIQLTIFCFCLLVHKTQSPPVAVTQVPIQVVHKTSIRHSKKLVAHSPLTPVPVVTVPDSNSMILRSQHNLHHFNFVFEGKATNEGQPYPSATVLVRLISGDQSVTQESTTGPDGSYSVKMALDAGDNTPIDWTINASTTDSKKVEISGSRIIQDAEEEEKTPVVMSVPVEFVVSLSK